MSLPAVDRRARPIDADGRLAGWGKDQTRDPVLQCSCGFHLWVPLGRLGTCDIGLYDDARFPGRLIVSLRDHYEQVDEVPEALWRDFMTDVQTVTRGLRGLIAADRVNVALLGNAEPHVHAHLVPRFSKAEDRPRNSPWQDPREWSALPQHHRDRLVSDLSAMLDQMGKPGT